MSETMQDTMKREQEEAIAMLMRANSALSRIFNTEEGESEEMTRCNMCMTELDSEVTICPTCKVDDYLMDYKKEGENE